MESIKDEIEVDPDYKITNQAIKRAESQPNDEGKIINIIKNEFDNELAFRRKHIENIEKSLFKAQKLLHLVRFALVSQYYNNSSLNANEGQHSNFDSSVISFDNQNRIHPAVKKLLGNNRSIEILNTNKRKAKLGTSTELNNLELNDIEPKPKKNKIEPDPYLLQTQVVNNIRNRIKVKKQIVIGNISKYNPTVEDNHLTHKWMMYVRGKDCDVSEFVQKIVFNLHPSYKPNDVIEVETPPYHLARKGWGEFPVRVQIFFKNYLNKPVDIIHNLTLDYKYSGRQTLGRETLVDIYLHVDKVEEEYFEECDAIEEAVVNKTESDELEKTSEDITLSDHSYSLPTEEKDIQCFIKEEIDIQENDLSLMYGLDESYNDTSFPAKSATDTHLNGKMIEKKIQKKIFLLPNNLKLTNGNIFLLKPKKVTQEIPIEIKPPINYEEFKLCIPENTFKNMGEVLLYLFKKLPLYTDLANNLNYKCTYPYVCKSFKEYSSLILSSKLSSEYCRAKTIKRILKINSFFDSENWNTKSIVMFGRSHSFTPLTTYSIFNLDSREKELILSCYVNSTELTKKQHEPEKTRIYVDIEAEDNCEEMNEDKVIDISDKALKPQCSFIRDTALECGIILRQEEILPNVLFNGAERMILEAVKSLADQLIRRARTHLVCEGNYNHMSAITKSHVGFALSERQEICSMLEREHKSDFFL